MPKGEAFRRGGERECREERGPETTWTSLLERWMNGWMDGWTEEWTNGLYNECTNGWINRQMDEYRETYRWVSYFCI